MKDNNWMGFQDFPNLNREDTKMLVCCPALRIYPIDEMFAGAQ
jgi:hypothetical protein